MGPQCSMSMTCELVLATTFPSFHLDLHCGVPHRLRCFVLFRKHVVRFWISDCRDGNGKTLVSRSMVRRSLLVRIGVKYRHSYSTLQHHKVKLRVRNTMNNQHVRACLRCVNQSAHVVDGPLEQKRKNCTATWIYCPRSVYLNSPSVSCRAHG